MVWIIRPTSNALVCTNWQTLSYGLLIPSDHWIGYIRYDEDNFFRDTTRGVTTYFSRGFTLIRIRRNRIMCQYTDPVVFDTFGSSNDANNMVTWINNAHEGDVIIGIVADSAETYLATVSGTFNALGIDATPLGFRYSMAFAAVKVPQNTRYKDKHYMISTIRSKLDFSTGMHRFQITETGRKPSLTPSSEHVVSTTTQCSIVCHRSTSCYSWATQQQTGGSRLSCYLYTQVDPITQFTSCYGCQYAIMMHIVTESLKEEIP